MIDDIKLEHCLNLGAHNRVDDVIDTEHHKNRNWHHVWRRRAQLGPQLPCIVVGGMACVVAVCGVIEAVLGACVVAWRQPLHDAVVGRDQSNDKK